MMYTEPASERRRILPAPRLRGLSPYVPPAPSAFVDLTLDANEGPEPCAALVAVLERVRTDDLRRYPSTVELESSLAAHHGVDVERVVLTNGADDAIERVCRVALEPGRKAVLHRPTFEMIERSAQLVGGEVQSVAWIDGQFPLGECVGAIDQSTSLVALVSPNNPTGSVISLRDMLEVARAAGRVGAITLVDLAYVDFADEDPTQALLDEPNVVVVRTFSKAMGLAGARVGYALASAEVSRWLRTAGGPYPVSSLSAALAGAALGASYERAEYLESVRAERGALTDALRRLGCEVLESQANFVTARFTNALFVQDSLASLGIAVRAFASRPELDGFLRITLPGESALFDRLLNGLHTILAPEGILFDLDGVLADVGGSYRQAIVQTARTFGVELTLGDISAAKRAGDANNDWELTQRLVEERGARCGLSEVVRRFQSIYEGSDRALALRETESLIPDPSTLRALAQRFTLGVVTGRPRREAEWFLERAGVSDLFAGLVCMEDAPAKPSPEPVQRAMAEIGVRYAWMVGDTPDDVVAARSARVLPIGVPAPGDSETQAREALRGSGAAAVIGELSQIGEMIR